MPVPMALGPFMFESLSFGFDGIRRDLSTRWADIATVGGLNHIQWTGGDDDLVDVKGVIFPHEFGGLATLEGIRASARSGAVLPLISLAGNVFGMYVTEGVNEDQSYHDRLGQPRKDVYRIGLKLYTGGSFSPVSVLTSLIRR